jgi:hypothetical protein
LFKKNNFKNNSAATTEGEGIYMKYASFLWPPVVAAISVSTPFF